MVYHSTSLQQCHISTSTFYRGISTKNEWWLLMGIRLKSMWTVDVSLQIEKTLTWRSGTWFTEVHHQWRNVAQLNGSLLYHPRFTGVSARAGPGQAREMQAQFHHHIGWHPQVTSNRNCFPANGASQSAHECHWVRGTLVSEIRPYLTSIMHSPLAWLSKFQPGRGTVREFQWTAKIWTSLRKSLAFVSPDFRNLSPPVHTPPGSFFISIRRIVTREEQPNAVDLIPFASHSHTRVEWLSQNILDMWVMEHDVASVPRDEVITIWNRENNSRSQMTSFSYWGVY